MANIYISVHSILNKVYCIVVEFCVIKNGEIIPPSFDEVLKKITTIRFLTFRFITICSLLIS